MTRVPPTQLHATPQGSGCHEALLYDTPEQLLARAVPFLTESIADGAATFLGLDPPARRLVLDAVGPSSGLTVLESAAPERPIDHLRRTDEMLRGLGTSRQIRILGDGAARTSPSGCDCLEAWVDHLVTRFPLWAVCVHRRMTTPPARLRTVRQTHRFVSDGRPSPSLNTAYRPPTAVIAGQGRSELARLRQRAPEVSLRNPTPELAGDVVFDALHRETSRVDAGDVLALATTAAVRNALAHGKLPIDVELWWGPLITILISDDGPGLEDPFAGLLVDPGERPDGSLASIYSAVDEVSAWHSDRTYLRLAHRILRH